MLSIDSLQAVAGKTASQVSTVASPTRLAKRLLLVSPRARSRERANNVITKTPRASRQGCKGERGCLCKPMADQRTQTSDDAPVRGFPDGPQPRKPPKERMGTARWYNGSA